MGDPDRAPQGPSGNWCSSKATSASDAVVIGVETGFATSDFKAEVAREAVMDVVPLTDLSDEAYSALAVYVHKGDKMLVMSIDGAGSTTREDCTKATALLAKANAGAAPMNRLAYQCYTLTNEG